MDTLSWIIFGIPAIVIASTVHEYAHAYSAYKLGDITAKMEGRLTLNPITHIDPVGFLMMLFFRFGWSKPVPVNEYNFVNPLTDTAKVAIAGPLSNLLLACLTWLLVAMTSSFIPSLILNFLIVFYIVNISLMVFNLLPLPPLDGHKIVRAILPLDLVYYWELIEKYSFVILLLIFLPFSPLSLFVSSFIRNTISFFLSLLII